MRRRRSILLPAILTLLVSTVSAGSASALPVESAPAAGSPQAVVSAGQVQLALKVSGLSSPVGVVNAGDGSGRLFIVEQRGTVRVYTGTTLLSGYFLDIRGVAGGISSGGERGLLGLAFHPDFESNRKLFVYYTNGGGDLVIAEMTANAGGTSASAGTVDPLLTIEHSAHGNHNGGQLLFGPDGYLYIFTGDGGGAGDPQGNAQNINSLLGKTLRIAPDLAGGYSNPAGNPYLGVAGADQIWSIGLRNPWRASFDRATGSLWIGDVGQYSWEEIDREPAASPGRNYGWNCREGTHNYAGGCSGLTLVGPVAEYSSGGATPHCSVTGGYVYRGSSFPDFVGQYVLGDYCSGYIWTLQAGAGSPSLQFQRDTSALISSFGESESGEIYMTDHGGRLYRIVAPPFSDVANSIHVDDITWLYEQGITGGCGGGMYCPKDTVTREQMASFLVRALNLPPSSTDYFSDDSSSPHEGDINALAAAGVTQGCQPGLFCPKSVVTRQQMASFLVRGYDIPVDSTDRFTDDDDSVHEADINALAAAGVTGGCAANRFCPYSPTTREQMASFLRRASE